MFSLSGCSHLRLPYRKLGAVFRQRLGRAGSATSLGAVCSNTPERLSHEYRGDSGIATVISAHTCSG